MKTGLIVFTLLFMTAGNVFPQVSLESFNKDWNITAEKLKTDLKDKKIIEKDVKGRNIISHEDLLDNMKVRVDDIFNKEGQLIMKTIGILSSEKDYKTLFDIFKNDAVKRYGSKFIQKTAEGKNLLIWQPDENTRVYMHYGGFMVQYNIMKNLKPKTGK